MLILCKLWITAPFFLFVNMLGTRSFLLSGINLQGNFYVMFAKLKSMEAHSCNLFITPIFFEILLTFCIVSSPSSGLLDANKEWKLHIQIVFNYLFSTQSITCLTGNIKKYCTKDKLLNDKNRKIWTFFKNLKNTIVVWIPLF